MIGLGRRPGTPQAGTPSGARDRQSDEGAPDGPMQHLAELRGVQAGCRRRACEPEPPKKKEKTNSLKLQSNPNLNDHHLQD